MMMGDYNINDAMETSLSDNKPVKYIPHIKARPMKRTTLSHTEKEENKSDNFSELWMNEEPIFHESGSLVNEFLSCLDKNKKDKDLDEKPVKKPQLINKHGLKNQSNSALSSNARNLYSRYRVKEDKKAVESMDYLNVKSFQESASIVDEFLSCLANHKKESDKTTEKDEPVIADNGNSHKEMIQTLSLEYDDVHEKRIVALQEMLNVKKDEPVIADKGESHKETKIHTPPLEYDDVHEKQIADLQEILNVKKDAPVKEKTVDDKDSSTANSNKVDISKKVDIFNKVDIFTLQEGVNHVREKMESDYVQLTAELDYEKERADRIFHDMKDLEQFIGYLHNNDEVREQTYDEIECIADTRKPKCYNYEEEVDDVHQKLLTENLHLSAELERERKRCQVMYNELENLKKELQNPQKVLTDASKHIFVGYIGYSLTDLEICVVKLYHDEIIQLKIKLRRIHQIMLKCRLDVFLSSNRDELNNYDEINTTSSRRAILPSEDNNEYISV